jgi:hypothetical protein
MRYRLVATYLGIPYYAGLGPDGNEVTLFSPGPPPDELGFTAAGGHWRKQVGVTDLDALWQSRLVGDYRGEPCLVLDDLGDRLHIAYQGRDSVRARQLGYWEIDREVFEVVAARQDVTGLTEERVEYPLDAAMFPASHRDPAAQPRPEVTTHGSAGPQAASGVLPAAAERTGPLRAVPQPGAQPAAEPAGWREPAGYAEPGPERSSSTLDRMAAWHGSPEAEPWPGPHSQPQPQPRLDPRTDPRTQPRTDPRAPRDPREPRESRESRPWATSPLPQPAPSAQPPARRAGRRDRVPQSVFAELLSLAAIPHAAYAVDEEVPGAMCLIKADGGFEVFSRTDDARLDVRFFEDEEAAYFYLFGVLAAEAVRSGRLRPGTPNGHVNGSRGPGVPSSSSAGNVSKYLRRKKLPK